MKIKKRINVFEYECIISDQKTKNIAYGKITSYTPMTKKAIRAMYLEDDKILINTTQTQVSKTYECSIEDFLKVAKPINGK